jgi:oligosaccharide repeat unit polymerase
MTGHKKPSQTGHIPKLIGTVVAIGLFIHYFGRTIADYISITYLDKEIQLFWYNKYTVTTLYELGVLFVVIVMAIIIITKSSEIKNKKTIKLGQTRDKWLLLVILASLTALFIATSPLTFNVSTRSVGQFNRSWVDYATRLKNLIYPLLAYYIVRFQLSKKDYITIGVITFLVMVTEVTSGNRREIFYVVFVVALAVIKNSHRINKKILAYGGLLTIPSTLAVALRRGVHNWTSHVTEAIIYQTASLGNNAILWKTKQIVDEHTGLLFGETFKAYAFSVLLPSPIQYALGISDTETARALNKFNIELGLATQNHGYGYMILADFYWNFGYVGYLLYIFFTVGCVYLSLKLYCSGNHFKSATGIVFLLYTIVHQRSDVGALINNVVYASIFIYVVHKVAISMSAHR